MSTKKEESSWRMEETALRGAS